MIVGMHAVIHTRDAGADRAFFRDVLGFSSVDAGDGWLIFAAPPSEVACHPADSNGKHELYLMCNDVHAEIAELSKKGIECGSVSDEGWGLLSTIHLPGGGDLGLYEPRHAMAHGTGKLIESTQSVSLHSDSHAHPCKGRLSQRGPNLMCMA
jgi:catechol 2,3-dioxygenase-like lactoylglutathione lyase family enzyme